MVYHQYRINLVLPLADTTKRCRTRHDVDAGITFYARVIPRVILRITWYYRNLFSYQISLKLVLKAVLPNLDYRLYSQLSRFTGTTELARYYRQKRPVGNTDSDPVRGKVLPEVLPVLLVVLPRVLPR